MLVVIVGAGLVGRRLSEILIRDNHRVVVVEKNQAVAAQVARELALKVVEGDGDDPKVLEDAGTREADVLIAVTGEDEDNLVACTLAKSEFLVRRVLARVNDPKNEWMFGKDMGVDIAVNQATLMAALLEEEITLGDLVTLLRLREGEVALVEKPIPAARSPSDVRSRTSACRRTRSAWRSGPLIALAAWLWQRQDLLAVNGVDQLGGGDIPCDEADEHDLIAGERRRE